MSTLPSVELGVLGPLQVRVDGRPVTVPGAKPRAILTMLGLHDGSVVPADTLIEMLWGDAPPRTAAKALQTHISLLRRTLGDGFVLTKGAGWTLAESDVDSTRYKAAVKAGRKAADEGDTSQAAARFDEALTLWRGIPELSDEPRGLSEKTRWLESHAALVEDRADALLATGRAAEVIGDLETAVAEAPLRERRWGQLMLALYRAGRQGEALGAYQRARTLLADQLGVDPGPDLRRLEAAIVAQDATLEISAGQDLSTITRAVTFLLTDIEGSTAAWEAEADAMAVALARHDELVEQVVTSRGGRLIKTRGEGDATFSVFERPSAAAAAAIELQDAIGQEPWALREPMRIRIALHTGEVELRDGDYFGRAVNRAARLRSLAEGGKILCSGATAELVIDSLRDDVVLDDLGMRQLRNLARPEHVFELRLDTAEDELEPASDAPIERPGLPAVLTGSGPFVGRGHELERLLLTWQSAQTNGVSAVLIAGEPGVGKTRLAGEWSQQAYQQGAVVLYGRCDEDLGAPYQPFAEALRTLVPCLGADRLRGLRGVEALLALVPGLIDVVPDLATPTRADPETERYALFDAVVAILEVASAAAPVVLILDDLHWAAKPTLLLLRHVLRFGEHARLQVVGTYRSTDVDRSHPLGAMLADLHRDGVASPLQLTGLDAEDVTIYVAEAGYEDEELARALASVTGGNPFFLIEALRHVDENGGAWDRNTLPQGVRDAVSRRLSRLTAEANKALAAAAVVGSRFALDLVERVVGQDPIDAFDEASKAGIIVEEQGGYYRFNHALVRQSLLAELASVRRMRLHQRIATTLEAQPRADDELLAELAHHYFECAWAGNAAKAAEYCRRAADQAMTRLAYEGAADLYDHALHALEELDDELPDRDEQAAELLVARCEALLAAGDVGSASAAVAQLRAATVNSARLAAWATSFDGELSMLIHPERLDEVQAALGAAADELARLNDAAGEAKAHTVRASCLARLGRIADCEVALDEALTAARRAREHRRVNAVLAGAPLAALWGPNPVPRAGGRCLDVVRLLRITTDSPAVEATSTRCQAVLEAFRGRAEAARRMIASARRTVTDLGLRHSLLEVEQFAGIVELVVDDPAAAEPCLRKAYKGFRRMGLDADTAETAALLGRACLALEREAEADELSRESERLAGNALKASIAWRTLRAQLLARRGEYDEARQLAEAAVARAERTDALVDHGDACLTLAKVLYSAGDAVAARVAAERAVSLYERKGAAALAEKARAVLGQRVQAVTVAAPEAPSVEPDNAAARVGGRMMAAMNRNAWDEVERLCAPTASVESRRKVVGFNLPFDVVLRGMRRDHETGSMRLNRVVIAARGDRLALARMVVSSADVAPGAPQDEFVALYDIDDEGRVAQLVWFDVDDIDAALAELDAAHARQITEPVNACVQVIRRGEAAIGRQDWEEFERLFAPEVIVESRRKVVGFAQMDVSLDDWPRVHRYFAETGGVRPTVTVIAVRGEHFALARTVLGTTDAAPGAPATEILQLFGIDGEGRITLQVIFDADDIDVALAELEAAHARFEQQPKARRLENTATRVTEHFQARFAARDWEALAEMVGHKSFTEDRRRVVNAGIRHARDSVDDLRALAEVGFNLTLLGVKAIRGERLALTHIGGSGHDPGAIAYDALNVVEVDADERFAAVVAFEVDDFDAAIAELDARYLAGEAAPHGRTWSMIAAGHAAVNRRELPPMTADPVSIDHRRGAAFAPGELLEYFRAGWDSDQSIRTYVEEVHRLTDLGAVCTHVGHGISREGFDAEWRGIDLLTVDGDRFNRCEVFDDGDLAMAIARFDRLSRPAPRLENAASQATDHLWSCFAARNWAELAGTLADDVATFDRRRVVNGGVIRGRERQTASLRASFEAGVESFTSTVIATRGERLALTCLHGTFRGLHGADVLNLVEVDADNRIASGTLFDPDDFDAAIAELDAQYLAGEAAPYQRVWSIIAGSYAAISRHEQPLITPDWITVDHRRETAMGPGDLIAYLGSNPIQDNKSYVERVHRLGNRGAVVTYAAHETSTEGFDAEWRGLAVFTIDGDMVSRCEVFDEADLDAAIATFEQLRQPVRRLGNVASRIYERGGTYFAARDWEATSKTMAPNMIDDDRRRTVNAGIRRGRDAEIANGKAIAELGADKFTSTVIATRGERLALCRTCIFGQGQQSEAFRIEFLSVIEFNTDEQMAAHVGFELDDFEAALAELDARYLVGEAAAHARTWSVIVENYAALNRHELPAMAPDCVSIDHRQGRAFAPGDVIAYARAALDHDHNILNYVEAIEVLNDLGVVFTHVGHETSPEGFDAEWRIVFICTVRDGMVNRCELFDEAELDAAIARFDQLSRPALKNVASQACERIHEYLEARDWDTAAKLCTENVTVDDRRRVVNAGVITGRDAAMADVQVAAEVGFMYKMLSVIATRGARLALIQVRASGFDPEAISNDALNLIELDSDGQIATVIVFDQEDIDAAFTELDARYLAGEAAAHASTWSVITRTFAGLNRHELPATTRDFVSLDHRRGAAFIPGDLFAYLEAAWDLTPDRRHYIEAVHRLNDLGAVFCAAAYGTSQDGLDAEWRMTPMVTVEDELIRCCEIFEEADLDAALALFDELQPRTRRLENTAARVNESFFKYFTLRDWVAIAELFAKDISYDDRRRVVNGGSWHSRDLVIENMRAISDFRVENLGFIATRGERLALSRWRWSNSDPTPETFHTEVLFLIEIDTEELIARLFVLDPDDLDSAFEALDARYLAGEAAAYARTWSVIAQTYAAFNRREFPPAALDSIYIDHRPLVTNDASELTTNIRVTWDLMDVCTYAAESVHRLSELGAVVSQTLKGTSKDGLDVDYRMIDVFTVDRGLLTRCEMFDEADLDAALARFDELNPPVPRLDNAATRLWARLADTFNRRDLDAFLAHSASNLRYEDRRKGLRDEFEGSAAQRKAVLALFEATPSNVQMTAKPVAVRGPRLSLMHVWYRDTRFADRPITVEMMQIVEVNDSGRLDFSVSFDPEDIAAAFEELDARYLAGEAAPYASTWSLMVRACAAFNQGDLPATTPDSVFVDHRPVLTVDAVDLPAYLRVMWDLTPDIRVNIEAVHRLSELGVVVTHAVNETSPEGFDAEWRGILIYTLDGDLINRCEVFDESDLDAALARFDELNQPPRSS